MRKEVLVLLLLLLPSVSAELEIIKPYCSDDGVMGFQLTPNDEMELIPSEEIEVLLQEGSNGLFKKIEGDWNRELVGWEEGSIQRTGIFETKEATVITEGVHRLLVKYTLGETEKELYASLGCKGTVFSCSLFDFSVTKCESNNGDFVAEFTTKGLEANNIYPETEQYSIDDVSVLLVTDKQYCDKAGACARTAGIPIKGSLEKIDSELYRISWPEYTSNVKSVSIRFEPGEKCLRKTLDYEYSVNDFKNCAPDPYVNEFVCTGCQSGDVCIPEGTSVVKDGTTLYCNNKKLLEQKPLGALCSQNSECVTNYCYEGRCTEELLRQCDEGLLFEPCRCQNVEVRDYDNKYCCEGIVKNEACNQQQVVNEETETITCSPGEVLDDGVCVVPTEEGFLDKIINFFRNLFS